MQVVNTYCGILIFAKITVYPNYDMIKETGQCHADFTVSITPAWFTKNKTRLTLT